jgi:hypothetical protein
LKDGNDGCTGNPLIAGRVAEWYSQDGLREFLDY